MFSIFPPRSGNQNEKERRFARQNCEIRFFVRRTLVIQWSRLEDGRYFDVIFPDLSIIALPPTAASNSFDNIPRIRPRSILNLQRWNILKECPRYVLLFIRILTWTRGWNFKRFFSRWKFSTVKILIDTFHEPLEGRKNFLRFTVAFVIPDLASLLKYRLLCT